MKKRGLICIAVCMLILLQILSPAALAQEQSDASVLQGSHTIDAQVPILGKEQLIANATSVLLYEASTDTLIYAWNADEQLYPASFVKIMTALLVLEKGNLDALVTVSSNVLSTVDEGAASVGLQADEVISVRDLLYCMLVASANDAAAVLADYMAGSQEAFVAEMNRRAEELGCTGTVFTDPHGLSDDGQVTTARDTGRILAEALKHEEFRTVFGTVHYMVPETNKSARRKLSTGNFLMNRDKMDIYYDSRVTGGRTGVTSTGDRCIAANSEFEGLELISVIMGAASEYEEGSTKVKSFGGFPETKQLLDKGFDGYRTVQIIYENQAIRQYPVTGGDAQLVVCPRISVATVLPQKIQRENLEYRYDFESTGSELQAPVNKGDKISCLTIWNGSVCLAQAELYAMNRVRVKEPAPDFISGPEKDHSVFLTVFIGILCAFALIALILLGSRYYHKLIRARRSRKNRSNRRRSR